MHEHSSSNSTYQSAPPELPPCCGTGCAVCVLDLVDDYMPPTPVKQSPEPAGAPASESASEPASEHICCNTGCLVCVNDHPELFRNGSTDAHTIELLEAMEAAERALQ